MNWLQNFIARLFRIEPARDRVITIREAHTFRENVIQNKLWYLGDGVTLEQYFKKTAKWDVEKARFWAATAQGNVRKIHSGIVGTVVDRYKDIVLADLDAVDFGENMDILEERWNEIFEGSKLNDVIGDAVSFAGVAPVQTWLPDFSTAGAVKKGEVEMNAAIALKTSKAAGVFRGIKVK